MKLKRITICVVLAISPLYGEQPTIDSKNNNEEEEGEMKAWKKRTDAKKSLSQLREQ